MPKAEKASKKAIKEKQIHPNSRKATQISKALHKEERRQRRKKELSQKVSCLCDKLVWFKNQLVEDKPKYSLPEVSELISRYIHRFDDRWEEIKEANKFNKEQGRHGRVHASEEDALKMVFEKEHGLFVAGQFEAPDLTNRKNVKTFMEWDEDTAGISTIKLKLFKEQALLQMDVGDCNISKED